jgi:hypothetical protein
MVVANGRLLGSASLNAALPWSIREALVWDQQLPISDSVQHDYVAVHKCANGAVRNRKFALTLIKIAEP